MKVPTSPPKPKFLSVEKLKKVIGSDSKYRHWDKLRHLTPPKGLSLQEWWSGLKFLRLQNARALPVEGFSFTLPDQVFESLHQIDLSMARPMQEVLNPFHFLSQEAITSSQIEGAVTTRKVAKEMLRSGRLPRDRSEQMIFNNFHVMQQLRYWKEFPLSLELIFEIHKIVTRKTLEAGGKLRKEEDGVEIVDVSSGEILHTPPKARLLHSHMKALCDFANKKTPNHFIHPVIRAIILHFWLAYDHPFLDGNGRTARALFYWLLLREGYWLVEYISISEIILQAPAKYGEAFLHTESDGNDLTYFILHQLDVIKRAFGQLHAYIEKKTKISIQASGLNPRQEALIAHALRHPKTRYTIAGHRNSHSIAYDTARTDLLVLHEMGFFEMRKISKAFVFISSPDLAILVRKLMS